MPDDQKESTSTSGSNTTSPPESFQTKFIEHVKANKIDVALWLTRLLVTIFTVGYILPIFGTSASYYNKVLLANAAASALRLHQRLETFTFSREFLARLILEDSCHYLFYSLIFLYVTPGFIPLLPATLFAILHAASYSIKMLDMLGQNAWWGARFIISIVEFQTTNILRMAAFLEIFLMPYSIIEVFLGRAGLMTPFIYYHFLVMRYTSRRNPFCRHMFSELRMATEALALKSPQVVARILRGGIAFVTRLAPPLQPAPAAAH